MTAGTNDKVAVVTGAAMGIGRGVAEMLTRRGYRVALFDVDGSVGQVADGLQAAGGDTIAIKGSVTEPDQVERALSESADRFGGIDLLVNCAGVVRYGTVEELSLEDWELQINTNLRSVFLMAKYGIAHLRARGGGVIVSIASVQAFVTQHGVPAYTASKGGIVALTRSLALDYAADGIRAVAVAPGSVDTPMLRKAAAISADATHSEAQILDEWSRSHPIGRVARVDDIAKLVAFLASDDAEMITGTTVVIDGGVTTQVGVNR